MRSRNRCLAPILFATVFAGCSTAPEKGAVPSSAAEAAPTAAPCPPGPPADAKCYRGRDSAGAHYLIAMPASWNNVLVVHAHGGPALGEPKIERADEDVKRWAIHVKAGYAYAASVFRQGGVAVRSAAEDTERVRQIFVQHIAKPRRTILHGQSWGANVAAKLAETHAAPGSKPAYDAVLLTSGVLAGGAASYAFRLDLRVIYQYLCNNHPKPDEPQYPLWMGLPEESKLTRQALQARVQECLGKAGSRTPEQARKVKTIVDVLKIPESSINAHLNWATWHFMDIATERTGRRNPFSNVGVVYKGSDDDAALNKGVARYAADPEAVRVFAADTDPTGRIGVPVISLHAIGDPTAFVEMQSSLKRAFERAGTSDNLVQAYTEHREHSYLADALYPAALASLLEWVDAGKKPSAASIAERCSAMEATFGPGCRVAVGYVPAPLAARIAPRPGI
jgi:alpha-beta hydrolase superfamily lysophospholipase